MGRLFIILSIISLFTVLNSCKNPCDGRLCVHGNTATHGSTCTCNCASGYQGSECNEDSTYGFLGGDVIVSEQWKIAGTNNGYLISITESHTPSSVIVFQIFLLGNQYSNLDSATVINPTTLQLNAVPVQLVTHGVTINYTYTGQGIKSADSMVVSGALMYGTTFVDSIRLVYQF